MPTSCATTALHAVPLSQVVTPIRPAATRPAAAVSPSPGGCRSAARPGASTRRSMPARGIRPLAPPHREQATSRWRVVAGAAIAGVLAVGILATVSDLLGSDGAPASAVGAQHSTGGERIMIAESGDTLWSIARAELDSSGPTSMSHRQYVEVLVELNGGPSIVAGQPVRLP